jgi:hypothetical protein
MRSNAATGYLLQRMNAPDGEWVSCRRIPLSPHSLPSAWQTNCSSGSRAKGRGDAGGRAVEFAAIGKLSPH